MKSLSSSLAVTGAAFLASVIVLAASAAPLGSTIFFGCVVVAWLAYLAMLARVWREDHAPSSLLIAAFALAIAFRLPLAFPSVGPDSDMMRYLWDGRVQTLGYNPYLVLPDDPALAATHTDETRNMPSRHARTPYPPAAQLFFRLVSAVHDSSRAMKLALVGCDLLTIVVLWRWLVITGRREWLALAYAWNPLVVLEVAHSGHIDALGTLWIAASAWWLAQGRTSLASVAFVLAVATKLLPLVLAPLYWRRIRVRDAIAGGVLFVLLYLPFTYGTSVPLGALPNVVAHIRFNGPLFRLVAAAATPQVAALTAVALGLLVALWARSRLDIADPAAWAWPMAVALACAPVVYPWYLLCLTPFLFAGSTLPLLAWALSVMPVYRVWALADEGGAWRTPVAVMVVEYGLPCAAVLVCAVLGLRGTRAAESVRRL
jgi:hypothetical protein